MNEAHTVSRARMVAAFAAVYVIWGSTYLAIRIAIESMPPFLMAGSRFVVSGGLLYAWSRARSEQRPTPRQWMSAAIVGTLLLMGGNGAVVWAEQSVDSGPVALLVATVPIWMVMLAWLWQGGARPTARIVGGLVLGLAGIALLIGPDALGAGRVSLVGGLVVLFGALSWAAGSVYSRSADLPRSPMLATAMEMLCGGAVLACAGLVTGETARFDPSAVTLNSAVALAYLVVFGSFVGFTSYIWLLTHSTPARAATYAYVNPVVAVLLGWLVVGEPLAVRTVVAAMVVLAAVALITSRTASGQPPAAAARRRGLASRFGRFVGHDPATAETTLR